MFICGMHRATQPAFYNICRVDIKTLFARNGNVRENSVCWMRRRSVFDFPGGALTHEAAAPKDDGLKSVREEVLFRGVFRLGGMRMRFGGSLGGVRGFGVELAASAAENVGIGRAGNDVAYEDEEAEQARQ